MNQSLPEASGIGAVGYNTLKPYARVFCPNFLSKFYNVLEILVHPPD
jgi:hypothetical protein